MACDEFFHRHFHKKITHTHPHVKEDYHHHTHLKEDGEAGMADEETERHLHEHTHEAAEHEHPVEHDPLHLSDQSEMNSEPI